MSRPGVGRTTWRALRARRRDVGRLCAWSLVESLPALLAGLVVARAVDQGFLAGRFAVGLAWLSGLAVAILVGALATGRVYRSLGEVVEPFRDELAGLVVHGALHDATGAGGRPDSAPVARLTHHVEIVRDTFGGLVMVVRGFLFTAGAALLGLLALDPTVAALVAAPLLVGLAVFAAALPAMLTHQRAQVRAGEALGRAAATALAGHRDVLACGAEQRTVAGVDRRVDDHDAAERTLARMSALRSLSLGLGGWLPVVVLLLAAPWLVRRGLSTGAVLGALVYVTTSLQPALHTLVQGLGGGGLRYAVTLERILRTCRPLRTATPRPRPPRNRPATPAVRVADLTFRYGPRARPILDGFSMDLPEGSTSRWWVPAEPASPPWPRSSPAWSSRNTELSTSPVGRWPQSPPPTGPRCGCSYRRRRTSSVAPWPTTSATCLRTPTTRQSKPPWPCSAPPPRPTTGWPGRHCRPGHALRR
ncbi:hypothetical protein GCM10029963_06780 [Micromonospora andamanensis]